MEPFALKSSQFRKERERSWRALDRILAQARSRGLKSLRAEDLHRLPNLYRGAVSSLSVARAISLDKSLLLYLEGLVSRAYILVYTSKRPPRQLMAEFFAHRFPQAAHGLRWFFAAASGLLFLGFACGFILTNEDLERYSSFIPEAMSQGRTPESSTDSLRDVLYNRKASAGGLTLFASFLFTHNAKVAILSFTLGFAAGLPTALLLFYNGLILGAMTALYHSRGMGGDFLAWVMGHGVTELAAVALCGAAGLAMGMSILFPGQRRRTDSLAQAGARVTPAVVGSVCMLFLAAIIEGYFRQLVPSAAARWTVAALSLALWALYFAGLGRQRAREEAGFERGALHPLVVP